MTPDIQLRLCASSRAGESQVTEVTLLQARRWLGFGGDAAIAALAATLHLNKRRK